MLHTLNGFLCAAIGFSLVDILNNHDKITWFTKENYEDYETDELGYVIDCEYARYCYISYDQWCNIYNCYEIYSNDYETKSGDKITAFGYYGHD